MAENLYYLRFQGKVHGPYSPATLQELHRKGQVPTTCEISRDGENWQPLGAFQLLQPGPQSLPEATPAMVPTLEPAPRLRSTSTHDSGEDELVFSQAAAEPWYYRFLEIYTKVGMWLGLALLILVLLGSLILMSAGFLSQTHGPGETFLFFLLAIPTLILFHLLWALGIVFGASLLLLLVDIGRRLRSIERHARQPRG